MLNNVAKTEDKKLQERQLIDVDRWFDSNVKIVEYHTQVPSHKSTSSTRPSTNMTTPRNGLQSHSAGTSFRNYRSISDKKQSVFAKPNNKELSSSKSAFMSPDRDKGTQDEEKPFMHKRLGPNFDPTCISPYSMGSPEFNKDLETEIMSSIRKSVVKLKVQQSVNQNLLQWSMQKRNLLVKHAFKKEMFSDSS